mmetsp:Transcript_101987/g.287913  ORF Transcript_101987/g.287913 Transcript_101987/m.287913 type:complete len:216 (+) Transcript_101987:1481-2128(+)
MDAPARTTCKEPSPPKASGRKPHAPPLCTTPIRRDRASAALTAPSSVRTRRMPPRSCSTRSCCSGLLPSTVLGARGRSRHGNKARSANRVADTEGRLFQPMRMVSGALGSPQRQRIVHRSISRTCMGPPSTLVCPREIHCDRSKSPRSKRRPNTRAPEAEVAPAAAVAADSPAAPSLHSAPPAPDALAADTLQPEASDLFAGSVAQPLRGSSSRM